MKLDSSKELPQTAGVSDTSVWPKLSSKCIETARLSDLPKSNKPNLGCKKVLAEIIHALLDRVLEINLEMDCPMLGEILKPYQQLG